MYKTFKISHWAMDIEKMMPDFEAIRCELQSLAYDNEGWLDPKDLMGCCAIASKWTADFLTANNFAVQIAHNDYHFWLRCNGYTIDLTASQFNPEYQILIEPQENEINHHWYNEPTAIDELSPEYFKKIGWPDEQNPFFYG